MHQCPFIRNVRIVRNALPFLLENRNFPVSYAIEELLLKKLGIRFLGNMGIIDGETLSLTFFADAVSKLLNKDVHKYMDKPVELEDELLDMGGTLDTTYTAERNVITNFRLHDYEPGNI